MNQSGGAQGGASAFSGLSDVAISSPSTGQVPVYNSGTGKWENGAVSATDSTKLPLAGGTMTGAINVATGASHQRKINNVLIEETKELGGAAGPPCRVLYDAAGSNGMFFTNSSGIIYNDLPTPDYRVRNAAASYARIGGWPLIPSDMPSQVAKYSRTTSNQGSLSGSYAKNTVALNSVDANPNSNWSFSGGVATCVNAGVYDVLAQLYYSSTEGFFVINHNGNAIGGYYYSSSASGLWGQVSVPGVSVGVGDTVEIDFFSSVAGGTIGNTYTGISVNAADKHATWLRLARRQ